MSGIYIHIPFCRKKCSYCNFFSVASLKAKSVFISALINEIELQKDYLRDDLIETVYFGGGTPSVLNSDEINLIYGKIQRSFNLSSKTEVTLEANPESLTDNYIKRLKDTGINRLSIGVQSFFDDDLLYLGRVHDARQAKKAIEDSLRHGFANLSIDLIYGIPGSNDEKWNYNLNKLESFGIDHFSAYSLTVEKETILDNLIKSGKKDNIDEDLSLSQFDILMEFGQKNGYEHYEISNFCRDGKYSKHNTSYWTGLRYLGLGPSAHSFNGDTRQWNVSALTDYVQSIGNGIVPYELELLTKEQKFNEYILVSLRTIWGCDTAYIAKTFGKNIFEHFIHSSEKHITQNNLKTEKGVFYLTRKGKYLADQITSDLFL